ATRIEDGGRDTDGDRDADGDVRPHGHAHSGADTDADRLERDRDDETSGQLENNGITVSTHKDHVLHEKREILTNDGTPYKVFTYYARKWRNRPSPEPVDTVSRIETCRLDPGTIPDADDLGLETTLSDPRWTPETSAARSRWDQFLSDDLINYHENRDFPARQSTSRLSPYLRFGLISPRRLREDCEEFYRSNELTDGVETFVDELIWRDFYHQVLYNFPSVTDENFLSKYDDLKWEDHPDWLQAWKEGRTGIPIVDAAQRQLNRTGWMHNRLRMITASFLTKDCFIHWKQGEAYFMNQLLDGDTAANNGGWQWAASTGTDAAPYFRIFNPYSQSEDYDPDGKFIRRYCPELRDLEGSDLHRPHEADDATLGEAGVTLGENYPHRILDHSARRENALEKFNAIES
ncbi:MAG: deoxyribodipyrimidine photo-lyase, partial [bacterium]